MVDYYKKFVNVHGEFYVPNQFLTFDDILLRPRMTTVKSRKYLSTKNIFSSNDSNTYHPLIPANMDTISGVQMVSHMWNTGGVGILHRFWESDLIYKSMIIDAAQKSDIGVGFSVGIGDNQSIEWISDVVDEINKIKDHASKFKIYICLDVAHADSFYALEKVSQILEKSFQYSNIHIIAGNIATGDAFMRFAELGVDAVKVGIGPGGMCQTRVVAGHGVPQLGAIMEIAACRDQYEELAGNRISIIADGGIRNSADVVKSLAVGADMIMIGSLFAGTIETPGNSFMNENGKLVKNYRGQASRKFMEEVGKEGVSPEGAAATIEVRGSIDSIIENLLGGLRSGMSYSGVFTIRELQQYSEPIVISNAGIAEGYAHNLHREGVFIDGQY